MNTKRHRTIVELTAAVLLCAALWYLLAPPALGGMTSYGMTNGISMEPRFHSGDLYVVRRQQSYHVGEIVAYHSSQALTGGATFLHRIIAGNGSTGFEIKGDNNPAADPDHPGNAQIIGALVLHVPGAGKLIASRNAKLILFGLGMFLLGVGVLRGRSRREATVRAGTRASATTNGPSGTPARTARRGATALPHRSRRAAANGRFLGVLAAAAFCLIALAALLGVPPNISQVETRQAPLESSFSYDGLAQRGATYPDGRYTNPSPVYMNAARTLVVRYRVKPAQRIGVLHGETTLTATISNDDGWQRDLPVQTLPSEAGAPNTGAVVDLGQFKALLADVQKETAMSLTGFTLTFSAHTNLAATRGATIWRLDETKAISFDVAAPFLLKLDRPKPDTSEIVHVNRPPQNPMAPTLEASRRQRVQVARQLAAGISVPTARILAGTGLLLALLAAAVDRWRRRHAS